MPAIGKSLDQNSQNCYHYKKHMILLCIEPLLFKGVDEYC